MGFLGFFSAKKAAKQAMEKEFDRRMQELDEQNAKEYNLISSKLNKPEHPIKVTVLSDTYHLINGDYFVWCNHDELIFELDVAGDLVLTARPDWNQKALAELGFDSQDYQFQALDPKDKRIFSLINCSNTAKFIVFPLDSIVGYSSEGSIESSNIVTGLEFKTSRKADVKSKTVTKDTRHGKLVIDDKEHGMYKIIIRYDTFGFLQSLLDSNKK